MFEGFMKNIKLNGFSFPIFGVSWDNGNTPKEQFAYLFEYLRSRRIFSHPYTLEIKEQCVQSVLNIRENLLEMMKGVSFTAQDLDLIRRLMSVIIFWIMSNLVRMDLIFLLIGKSIHIWMLHLQPRCEDSAMSLCML